MLCRCLNSPVSYNMPFNLMSCSQERKKFQPVWAFCHLNWRKQKKKRKNRTIPPTDHPLLPLRHSSGTCHFLSTVGKGSSEEPPSVTQCWRQCEHFFQGVPLGIAGSSNRSFVCSMFKWYWLLVRWYMKIMSQMCYFMMNYSNTHKWCVSDAMRMIAHIKHGKMLHIIHSFIIILLQNMSNDQLHKLSLASL